MKKRIFNLLFLCGVAVFASAQSLHVDDVQVIKGKSASFALNVDVDGNSYTGLQFEMNLPTGVATTGNKALLASWDGGSITVKAGKTGCSCITTNNEAFIPDGILGTIEFSVDGKVEEGTYPVTLSNITFMTSTVRKDVADVTFNLIVVDALTLSETSTTAPAPATGVKVKVERTFTGGKWSTICLPFAMTAQQVTTAFGSGVKLGDFDSYDPVYDGDNVTSISVKFSEVNEIEANHPYIIKVETDKTEFIVDGVDITPEEEAYVEFDNGKSGRQRQVYGTFLGTYVAGTAVPAKSLFLGDGKFYYATSSTKPMKAFRAYFDLVDVLAAADEAGARIKITFDDITGIKDARNYNGEEIYTLSGQRVNKAGKGVYIVNGKKVIKK